MSDRIINLAVARGLINGRNYVTNPRTLKEGLQVICNAYYDGFLGKHLYRRLDGDNRTEYCAIGMLFTDAQLDDIEDIESSNEHIVGLTEYIGRKNLKAMTGMTLAQCKVMQQVNDGYSAEEGMLSREACKEIFADIRNALALKRKTITIHGVRFNIGDK